MKLDEATSTVIGCSISGYYKWKKEGRLIIRLLEKYFTKEDLVEFINTGKIFRLSRAEYKYEFEKDLYEGYIDDNIGFLITTEFIIDIVINFKNDENYKTTKNDFVYFLHEKFDVLIDEINENRNNDDDQILADEKKHTFCEIMDMINGLSEREFKYIVDSSEFFNPFNLNYTE